MSRRRRHRRREVRTVDLGPATPRPDRVPCRTCYLPVRPAGDSWEHLVAGACTSPAPFTLAQWEQAYAKWRGTTVAELHLAGLHAEVCSCPVDECPGFVVVDVHTCALWIDHRRRKALPVPPARELW